MGVGAAMARGNQGENGKIALFVIKVTPKRKTTLTEIVMEEKEKRSGQKKKNETIEQINKQSPIRFIKIVFKPEKIEELF